MTHEERAHEVLDTLAPAVRTGAQDRFVSDNLRYLAEQFREVERETKEREMKIWHEMTKDIQRG